MDEHRDYQDVRTNKGKQFTVIQKRFVINILYSPEQTQNNGGLSSHRDGVNTCEVTILSKKNAYAVYRDLIKQIREQCPDQLFLDKAMDNLLAGDDGGESNISFGNSNDDDCFDLAEMEKINDRSPKKASKPRKAKRPNKKVLRRTR